MPRENSNRLIQLMIDTGHDRSTTHPTDVAEKDYPTLQLHDKPVREWIKSYQTFMQADLERISLDVHGRHALIDGELGPATEELFGMPRCGLPDYLMAGYEEGNFPTSCRGKLKWGRSFDSLPGLSKSDTDKVFWSMANNWTTALTDVEITIAEPRDRQGCHIYADLKRLGGSTLAWSYLAQNSCRELAQAYDTRNWSISLGSPVGTHETGHALGMSHVRDSDALMYPSIHSRSIARRGFPNNTDLAGMRALGYTLSGKPQIPGDALFRPRGQEPDEPDPPTPPDGTNLFFTGSFRLTDDAGNDYGKFILTPDPGV